MKTLLYILTLLVCTLESSGQSAFPSFLRNSGTMQLWNQYVNEEPMTDYNRVFYSKDLDFEKSFFSIIVYRTISKDFLFEFPFDKDIVELISPRGANFFSMK